LGLKFDLVVFEEVTGANFKLEGKWEMYKGHTVEGSFLKGDDDGIVRTEISIEVMHVKFHSSRLEVR
jgi:predicted ATP-dependent Lon-type protease